MLPRPGSTAAEIDAQMVELAGAVDTRQCAEIPEPGSLARPHGKFDDTQVAETLPVLRTGFAMPDVETQMRELLPQLSPAAADADVLVKPFEPRIPDMAEMCVYLEAQLWTYNDDGLWAFNEGPWLEPESAYGLAKRWAHLGKVDWYIEPTSREYFIYHRTDWDDLFNEMVALEQGIDGYTLTMALTSKVYEKQSLGCLTRWGSAPRVLTTSKPWTDVEISARLSSVERQLLSTGWAYHADHGVWQYNAGALLNLDNAIRYQLIVFGTDWGNEWRAEYYQGRVDFMDIPWSLTEYASTFGEKASARGWSDSDTVCVGQRTTLLSCGWDEVTILHCFQLQGGPPLSLAHAHAMHEMLLTCGDNTIAETIVGAYQDGANIWSAEFAETLPKPATPDVNQIPAWLEQINTLRAHGWKPDSDNNALWTNKMFGDKVFTTAEAIATVSALEFSSNLARAGEHIDHTRAHCGDDIEWLRQRGWRTKLDQAGNERWCHITYHIADTTGFTFEDAKVRQLADDDVHAWEGNEYLIANGWNPSEGQWYHVRDGYMPRNAALLHLNATSEYYC